MAATERVHLLLTGLASAAAVVSVYFAWQANAIQERNERADVIVTDMTGPQPSGEYGGVSWIAPCSLSSGEVIWHMYSETDALLNNRGGAPVSVWEVGIEGWGPTEWGVSTVARANASPLPRTEAVPFEVPAHQAVRVVVRADTLVAAEDVGDGELAETADELMAWEPHRLSWLFRLSNGQTVGYSADTYSSGPPGYIEHPEEHATPCG